MNKQKIVTTDIVNHNSFSLDESGEFYFTSGYGIIPKIEIPIKYLLGILNSKLLEWALKRQSTTFRGGYYSSEARFIKSLPIFFDIKNNPNAESIAQLVDKIIEINKKKNLTADVTKKDLFKRETKVYEEKIDELVYALYGLTAEERQIVEESVK